MYSLSFKFFKNKKAPDFSEAIRCAGDSPESSGEPTLISI